MSRSLPLFFLVLPLACFNQKPLTEAEILTKELERNGCSISEDFSPESGPALVYFGLFVPGEISPKRIEITNKLILKLRIFTRVKEVHFNNSDINHDQIIDILGILKPKNIVFNNTSVNDQVVNFIVTQGFAEDLVFENTGITEKLAFEFSHLKHLWQLIIHEKFITDDVAEKLKKQYSGLKYISFKPPK